MYYFPESILLSPSPPSSSFCLVIYYLQFYVHSTPTSSSRLSVETRKKEERISTFQDFDEFLEEGGGLGCQPPRTYLTTGRAKSNPAHSSAHKPPKFVRIRHKAPNPIFELELSPQRIINQRPTF